MMEALALSLCTTLFDRPSTATIILPTHWCPVTVVRDRIGPVHRCPAETTPLDHKLSAQKFKSSLLTNHLLLSSDPDYLFFHTVTNLFSSHPYNNSIRSRQSEHISRLSSHREEGSLTLTSRFIYHVGAEFSSRINPIRTSGLVVKSKLPIFSQEMVRIHSWSMLGPRVRFPAGSSIFESPVHFS